MIPRSGKFRIPNMLTKDGVKLTHEEYLEKPPKDLEFDDLVLNCKPGTPEDHIDKSFYQFTKNQELSKVTQMMMNVVDLMPVQKVIQITSDIVNPESSRRRTQSMGSHTGTRRPNPGVIRARRIERTMNKPIEHLDLSRRIRCKRTTYDMFREESMPKVVEQPEEEKHTIPELKPG